MIPFFRVNLDKKELNQVKKVFKSKVLVQSNFVKEFENKLVDYVGSKHCTAVSSGTAALHLAFMALELNKNDGVLIPNYAWPSAANVVHLMGGHVIPVDVSRTTYNMTASELEKAIKKAKEQSIKIKFLVLIHQFGLISEVEEIISIAMKNNLIIIEDAACALGSSYKSNQAGTFGKVAIFSFHPRKSITTGEGGAIFTDDEFLDREVKSLRNHGQEFSNDGSRKFIQAGLNYRMTEIQAAIGIAQLNKLTSIINRKFALVELYNKHLKHELITSIPVLNQEHTYQTFMITLDAKVNIDDLIFELKTNGIETIRGSAAIQNLDFIENKLGQENTKYLLESAIALPLYPTLRNKDVKFIASTLNNLLSELELLNSNGNH
jgi:dTDP-4-amino-4,6-dideoxygalactose transaminase